MFNEKKTSSEQPCITLMDTYNVKKIVHHFQIRF